MEDFRGSTSRLADQLIYEGCKKLVEVFRGMFSQFMQAFLHYLSRQNLNCVKEGAIDIHESNFF